MKYIYMDYNATTPLKPLVFDGRRGLFEECGNPSSVHGFGRRARQYVESARSKLAQILNAQTSQIVFTSGGSEANNLALQGTQNYKTSGESRHIFVSAIEHPCVLNPAKALAGEHLSIIPVDDNGVIDCAWFRDNLKKVDAPSIVSVMYANNETGVIQPIRQLVDIAKEFDCIVHCDAVQAFGKVPLDFDALGVDMMSLSSHKVGGMTGTGALIHKEEIEFDSLIKGGGQEKGRRSGTENIQGIHAFGLVIDALSYDINNRAKQQAMRDCLEAKLIAMVPDLKIFSQNADRLPNTSCFAMPGIAGIHQVIGLDLEGIAVSSGSACSSGKTTSSHVLAAMRVTSEESGSALRVSLGWQSTASDVDCFVAAWKKVMQRIDASKIKK
jgi:cysteine desulfurase